MWRSRGFLSPDFDSIGAASIVNSKVSGITEGKGHKGAKGAHGAHGKAGALYRGPYSGGSGSYSGFSAFGGSELSGWSNSTPGDDANRIRLLEAERIRLYLEALQAAESQARLVK